MKHRLILEGEMRARCACGQWMYIGLTSEARASIKKVFQYHTDVDPTPKKKKKR